MIRVLVVDDDFRVADLHAAVVRTLPGFEVVALAHTAGQAVAASRSHRPDLVLLDEYLPDRRGTDVLGELAGDVLMLTAADDATTVRTALSGGVVHYLRKPFTPAQLTDRLAAYARYVAQFRADAHLDQAAIDRVAALLHAADRVTSEAGAAGTLTARRVRDAAAAPGGPHTAAEIATTVGVSRATAQRHLARLARSGAVELTLRYGTTGRPEHLYEAPEP